MKKFLLVIIGLLALLLFASQIFKAQIGERLFTRMVDTRLGANPHADLPDGLHVFLIGTGSPLADPSRAGPSTGILAGERLFIIDSGGGSVRNFGSQGIQPGQIERVLLTHFHSDHIDGLGELMLQRWVNRAAVSPLPVHGPEGVEDIVTGLNMAYAQDREYRIAHHGEAVVPPSGYGGHALPFDGSRETVLIDDEDLKVTAFPVYHEPVSPAVGYRFDYKGRSVSLTGDTAAGPGLAAAMKGSDLIISEALNVDMVKVMEATAGKRGAKNMAKIMADIQDYHMTPVQAADMANEAGANTLVYSHIVPILPTPYLYKYFLKGTSEAFDGNIHMGEDGMTFSLPAGSEAVDMRD